jgi:hypothetical protein
MLAVGLVEGDNKLELPGFVWMDMMVLSGTVDLCSVSEAAVAGENKTAGARIVGMGRLVRLLLAERLTHSPLYSVAGR